MLRPKCQVGRIVCLGDRCIKMTSAQAAGSWTTPIDLLLLDADQTPEGARDAYISWTPFLKPGGILTINASSEAPNEPGHDGQMSVIREYLRDPAYFDIRCVEGITFARKSPAASHCNRACWCRS